MRINRAKMWHDYVFLRLIFSLTLCRHLCFMRARRFSLYWKKKFWVLFLLDCIPLNHWLWESDSFISLCFQLSKNRDSVWIIGMMGTNCELQLILHLLINTRRIRTPSKRDFKFKPVSAFFLFKEVGWFAMICFVLLIQQRRTTTAAS